MTANDILYGRQAGRVIPAAPGPAFSAAPCQQRSVDELNAMFAPAEDFAWFTCSVCGEPQVLPVGDYDQKCIMTRFCAENGGRLNRKPAEGAPPKRRRR